MSIRVFHICLMFLTFIFSPSVFSENTTKAVATGEYVHQGKKYPPVLFITDIDSSSFEEKLESYEAFSSLDETSIGLPIGVRVLTALRREDDARTFSSGMVSAATLGLVPVLSNKTFKVRYDIFVQGKSLEKFEYEMTSSDVENLWQYSRQGQARELKESEELFLNNTINQFLNDVSKSDKVQEIFSEYYQYYGG